MKNSLPERAVPPTNASDPLKVIAQDRQMLTALRRPEIRLLAAPCSGKIGP